MDGITQQHLLYFMIRVILGCLFFFQGMDKVFNIKIGGVVEFFRAESAHKHIPGFLLVISAWFTSLAELVCGALLILGLFTLPSMYVLGLDLILVCGAFSLLKPMWDMQLLFPRLILLAILLYLPLELNVIAVDGLLNF